MTIGPGHYAVLSAIVFTLGLYGVLTRANLFAILIALVLLFAAPVIALVGFAAALPLGDALAFLAVLASAAEALVGVGIAFLLWRRIGSSDRDDLVDVEG
jgi:NADH-quinone oxidoreductase subunit K